MKLGLAERCGGAAALALTLAGCVDVKLDVAVKDGDAVTGTMVQVMDGDTYTMFKSGGATGKDFCMEAGASLEEKSDGSATCTIVRSGTWSNLVFDEDRHKETISITPGDEGEVRVAFPVNEIVSALGNRQELDEQARSMLIAMFQGHTLTLSVSGAEITETNMQLEPDAHMAAEKIDFLDLLNGSANLPEEYYAVVKVK